MAALKIEKIETGEGLGYFDPERHHAYLLTINFADGAQLKFSYVVLKAHAENWRNEWNDEDSKRLDTIDPNEFDVAFRAGKKLEFGGIWHDYCWDTPIRTKEGKISFYLADSGIPSFILSPTLAEQFITELKKYK